MRRTALALLTVALALTIAGCDTPTIPEATREALVALATVYLAGNYAEFEQGMALRGWTVPPELCQWEQFAKDLVYVAQYVAEHGGTPPLQGTVATSQVPSAEPGGGLLEAFSAGGRR